MKKWYIFVDIAEESSQYSFKCKGKIIGILVSYHAGNLSTLNIGLYKQVFCFFQTFPDDVTVTAFSGTGLKYARQISGGDEQL